LSAGPRKQNCDFRKPFNTRYPFRGKLYLLIGPDTYSSGIGFATVLQDHGLATLIGEKTDDTASGCGGITIPGLSLPRTGLIYYLSTICFIRPSGEYNDQGVIPDVIVETTIQDRLAGQDPVLQSTLEMIRNSE
jgi:C-terminal processing protease CtpA/Prc